jgi:hypothetical protein
MTHIVEDCFLTTLEGGLKALHTADDEAVTWLGKNCHQLAVDKSTYNKSIQLFTGASKRLKTIENRLSMTTQPGCQRCESGSRPAHLCI